MAKQPARMDPHANDIWNPWAALALSIIFTPAFGAILHETDLRHIGDEEGAASAYMWSRGAMALLAVAAIIQPVAAVRPGWELTLLAVDMGLLAAWALSCGFRHARLIAEVQRESRKFIAVPFGRAITLGLLGLMAWAVLFHIAKSLWTLSGFLPA